MSEKKEVSSSMPPIREQTKSFEKMNGRQAEMAVLGRTHQEMFVGKPRFDKIFRRKQRENNNSPLSALQELQKEHPKEKLERRFIELFYQDNLQEHLRYSPWMGNIIGILRSHLEDKYEVSFVSTLNSMYDFIYRTDGFFLFVDKEDPSIKYYITIDFTLNDEKVKEGSNAVDLVVSSEINEDPQQVAKNVGKALNMKKTQDPIKKALQDSISQTENEQKPITVQERTKTGVKEVTLHPGPRPEKTRNTLSLEIGAVSEATRERLANAQPLPEK